MKCRATHFYSVQDIIKLNLDEHDLARLSSPLFAGLANSVTLDEMVGKMCDDGVEKTHIVKFTLSVSLVSKDKLES